MDHSALADASEAESTNACRQIGKVGTGARVLVGAAMLYGAFAIDGSRRQSGPPNFLGRAQ